MVREPSNFPYSFRTRTYCMMSTLAYSKDMHNTTERDDYEDSPGSSSTCEDPGMPGHLTCAADKPCVPATFVMTTEARLAGRDRIRAIKAARLAAAR